MNEKYESSSELSESNGEYTDVISLKTVSEMDDPVLSPHTGHVYDRVDIAEWIHKKGTDPIDIDKPLNDSMLVSGRFVKQLSVDAQKKEEKYMQMFADMQMMIQEHKKYSDISIQQLGTEISTLKKDNGLLREDLHQTRGELTQVSLKLELATEQLKESQNKVEQLAEENDQLRYENIRLCQEIKDLKESYADKVEQLAEENSQLRNENARLDDEIRNLKKGYVNPVYAKFSSEIENKIQKGSSKERELLLKRFASKVKSASDDETLKKAVNDIAPLLRSEISEPRYFPVLSFFGLVSETTQVALELRDKINRDKGFQLQK